MVHKHSSFYTRKMNQGKTLSPVTICLNRLCSTFVRLVSTLTALKIILLYVQGCEKRKPKHTIMDWSQNRTETLFFINLDRQLFVELLSSHEARTTLKARQMLVSSFTDIHFLNLNIGQTCMTLTLDLKTRFLEQSFMREVINHSTHIHLLYTIKSILTQTLEKIYKKRVYGKQTLTIYISEIL